MKYILVVSMILFSGCSVNKIIPGQVAHQVVVCTSNDQCKERLARECPKGGVLHGIRQAVEIEYSCNS